MMKRITIIAFFISFVNPLASCAQSVSGKTNEVQLKIGLPKADTIKPAYELLGLSKSNLPVYKALIIGVSKYKNATLSFPNLDLPVDDARRIKDLLVKKYTFESENVVFLENPDKKTIINTLESLTETITDKDNLLVFYAGHGYYDKNKDFGYWLPADADINERSSWIPNSLLKDYLGAIKSKHTLLIADACFSGSIFKTREGTSADAMARFAELYRYPSKRAITSGNLSTVPDKSVFLDFLYKKLDENNDVFLSTHLLFSRMYEPISNNTNVLPRFGVIQGVGDEGGDFIFIRK